MTLPVRPLRILTSVSADRVIRWSTLFWSRTVRVSPWMAVISPLTVLLSPSAATAGKAAHRARNATSIKQWNLRVDIGVLRQDWEKRVPQATRADSCLLGKRGGVTPP